MPTPFTLDDVRASRAWLARRDAERREVREGLRLERLGEVRRAVAELAAEEPGLHGVWLFGSILRPGRFHQGSDVDLAVDCDDPRVESRFWGALEQRLRVNCDVRPRIGAIARAVEEEGEKIYPAPEEAEG